MPKPMAAVLERLRQSLWLIPALAIALALVAAELMVWASAYVTLPKLPLVFSGGPDAAQALLQAIAGSVITVAGVTFSVTIVALQLTSTQFSPRVLRNFLRDRANQSVLAAFLATFVYTLLVLGSVRTGTDGREPLVPVLAVVGAVALTLLSIGMLAFFVHHIAHTIQVSEITHSVARETLDVVRREWRAADEEPDAPMPEPTDEFAFRSRDSGYLAFVGHERLVEMASEADAVLRVRVGPGGWVGIGQPLVSVSPADARERLRGDPRDAIKLDLQPTLQQDVSFGIRQLVDVALKALSPSLNDPSTAINCIHRITDVLLECGRRLEPPASHADEAGTVRLLTPQHNFDDLVGLGFDQIRHDGQDRFYVALTMAHALNALVEELPAHRHPVIRRQARLLGEMIASLEPDTDRRVVLDALRTSSLPAPDTAETGKEPRS